MSLYRDDMQAALARAEQLVSANDELEQEAQALSHENAELRARLRVAEGVGNPIAEPTSDASASAKPIGLAFPVKL
jgi:hypothetical protein